MKNKKILICDDDEGVLDMLELILEDTSYQIIAEQNSLNILGLIDELSPDLILLDLWMPVLSGDQVLRVIRNDPLTENMPVIIISASREGRQIAQAAGASAFISKPFDFNELISAINHHIG